MLDIVKIVLIHGGVFPYAELLLLPLAIGLALVHLVKGTAAARNATLVAVGLIVLLGVGGWRVGLAKTQAAVAMLGNPDAEDLSRYPAEEREKAAKEIASRREMIAQIREVGSTEAFYGFQFGLVVAALPALLFVLGLLRPRARPAPGVDPASGA